MNNLYHWHDEKMVSLKMQELNREIEQIHLLNEVSCSNPSWLARKAKALGGWLIARGERLQKNSYAEDQASQTTSSKLAT